jgi:hypothetical protein
MQSKESLVSGLHGYAIKMRSIIIEANIKPSYVQIPDNTDNVSIVELEEGLEWLKGVHDNQWTLCCETKLLLPEDQWDHYKAMDMDGTIEMRELKKRLRDLRKVIISKDRPRIFRKKSNGKAQRQRQDPAKKSTQQKEEGERDQASS